MIGRFRTVSKILEQLAASSLARKRDLGSGDYVVVTTENSVYSIQVLEGSNYVVRGGWFDRQRLSPVTTSIAGCTWGGTVIKTDVVAACGLHLEFGNRILTSRIRDVLVIPGGRESLRPVHAADLLCECYGSRWERASAA